MKQEEDLVKIGKELETKECPDLMKNILQIQDTLDVLAGKWKVPVLFSVLKGKRKFSEIKSFCVGISDKILNQRLTDLIENKMIIKENGAYYLTEHGIALYKVIQELWRWGCRHRHVMLGEPFADTYD